MARGRKSRTCTKRSYGLAAPKPLKQHTTNKEYLKKLENLAQIKVESLDYDCILDCETPYILKDAQGQEFYLIPKNAIHQYIQALKDLKNERYLFKLKQEIYRNMPVDFDDVWCIALQEVKNYKKEPSTIVKHLKKQYPYLFLNFLDATNH